MNELFESGVIWWITAVDLPVFSGLFWLVFHVRQEAKESVENLRSAMDFRTAQLKESIAAFKLEAAKSYASIGDMKDLEVRIVSHLLRIEAKLDRTALKTEALKATRTE